MTDVVPLPPRALDVCAEHSPLPHLLLGEGGVVHGLNRAAAALLGPDAERARGRRFELLLDDASRTHFSALLRRVQGAGLPGRLEVRLARAQGVHLLLDAAPHAGGALLAASDISALKGAQDGLLARAAALEARVQARTALAHDLNAELEALVHTVTQGLRAPLQRARVGAAVLRAPGGDPEERGRRRGDVLGDVLGGVEDMEALLGALGAYLRLGRQRARFVPVSLEGVLDGVRRDLGPRLQGVGWRQDPLPTVTADRRCLHLVFAQLLDNALKFQPQDPAHAPDIRIRARETEREHHIGVEDNGVGFNPRQRERLFDLFERLHPARGDPGLGTGLALVRRVVHRHGGRVWAEARAGGGSAFWFALPKVQPVPP